jgi:hypothetical protein
MFDEAALALEEIEPDEKMRTEILGTRVALYKAAKKNGTWSWRLLAIW